MPMTRKDTAKAGEWRFLQLALFMAAWMLLAPLRQEHWLVQALTQAFC